MYGINLGYESGSKSCCFKEGGTKFQVILWIPPTTFQHVYKFSALQTLCQFSLPDLPEATED